MSPTTAVVQGVLKADGTLELDEKPCLEPGRVQVILHTAIAGSPTLGSLAGTIEEIRRYQQRVDYVGPTPEALARHDEIRRADEEDYEERMRKIRSQTRSESSLRET